VVAPFIHSPARIPDFSKVRRVLFVCYGNINRSPFAEEYARARFAESHMPIEVRSAGTAARPGTPATLQAQGAIAQYGTTLAGHRAQRISSELVSWADTIIYMDNTNRAALLEAFPDTGDKMYSLASVAGMREISDPDGLSQSMYTDVFTHIARAINALIERA
ncbi:MAG: low molecular weight protein arginine phosphatase, partial [Candidatus Adlerbacteria bacterium]|nr:low molecular weight protein arginine phosphatase [Candidatus Adlerbacteria bacterium]